MADSTEILSARAHAHAHAHAHGPLTDSTSSISSNASNASNVDFSDRRIKKDMATIIRENQKLQLELKGRNETITQLINQNFTELKALQDKHAEITVDLMTNYDAKIQKMIDIDTTFKLNLKKRLKKNFIIGNMMDQKRSAMLTNHNDRLDSTIKRLESEAEEKDRVIEDLRQKNLQLSFDVDAGKVTVSTLTQQQQVVKELEEKVIHYENLLHKTETTLASTSNALEITRGNMKAKQTELTNCLAISERFETDCARINLSYGELYNKYSLLLSDNSSKQNIIDEKTIELLNNKSKISGIEKRNSILEENNEKAQIDFIELTGRYDICHAELITERKRIDQLTDEKNIVTDEKFYYIKEYELLKIKYSELELSLTDKISEMQNSFDQKKTEYILGAKNKVAHTKEKCNKQIVSVRSDYAALLSEKESEISGLTNHLKSFTESQHICFNKLEQLKHENERLKVETGGSNQKINAVLTEHGRELEDTKNAHQKEKDAIMQSYSEIIKKSQENNDILQHRLNQAIETLTLSKATISGLKDSTQYLEKQVQDKESEDNILKEKYDRLKHENLNLKDKLDRSIEINNNYDSKERQHDLQLKQMHIKYNQLLSMSKQT